MPSGRTRSRVYGSDVPFCAWLRHCKCLPATSYDSSFGLSVYDNDLTLHRYCTKVDTRGTRLVQMMMQLEVKTRWSSERGTGWPTDAQLDSLCKLNAFAGRKIRRGQTVRNFGVFILLLSGTSPDNSQQMRWGVLPVDDFLEERADYKSIPWRPMDRAVLIQLLAFQIHPRTLRPLDLRRHHKTQVLMVRERLPLGFMSNRLVTVRS